MLVISFNIAHAQYIIEGAKYRSIRDSVIGNGKPQLQKDPINSITLNYQLTGTEFYTDPNKMPWEKIEPLIKSYSGQKIRHILVQHGSGKAIIVLKGKDSINITESAAIKEGILPNSFYSIKEIIKVDSPLYVGSNIPVYIKLQDPENRLVSLQAGITSTGTPFKYELQSYLPGDVWVMEIGADGKTKKIYAYVLLPDPGQPGITPDFYIGEIRSAIPDYNLFKQQHKINVTDGYKFSGCSIYLTGPGADNVKQISIATASLLTAKSLMDLCFPGSTVMFDDVTLVDADGEKHVPMGKSYTLIDKDDIRDSYAGLFTRAHFTGGMLALYQYIIETLIRLPNVNITKGKFDFNFSFIVEADGRVTDIFKNDFSGKDEIYEACHNLIQFSNTWIPAFYKGEYIRTPVNISFTIEIK